MDPSLIPSPIIAAPTLSLAAGDANRSFTSLPQSIQIVKETVRKDVQVQNMDCWATFAQQAPEAEAAAAEAAEKDVGVDDLWNEFGNAVRGLSPAGVLDDPHTRSQSLCFRGIVLSP